MDKNDWNYLGLLLMASLVGLGNLLASKEKLTTRIIVGRAIASAGLGAASTLVMIWFPSLPYTVQIGAACLCASLGVSFLERIVQKILKGGK